VNNSSDKCIQFESNPRRLFNSSSQAIAYLARWIEMLSPMFVKQKKIMNSEPNTEQTLTYTGARFESQAFYIDV
jgi:hypothetical protein